MAVSEIADPIDVIRRRVRLISLMQESPISRYSVADITSVTHKTIQRDIEWLSGRGVPIAGEQADPKVARMWSVPKKFDVKKWLWSLVAE
jgi:hypothetical protein